MIHHMLTDRETRLREKIDWLTDQRDRAIEDLHRVRDERDRARRRLRTVEKQVGLWKHRALRKAGLRTGGGSSIPPAACTEPELTAHSTAAAGTDMRVSAPAAAEGTHHAR